VISPTEQLDNPVWHSLIGRDADKAIGSPLARAYPADMSPFFGLPSEPAAENWEAAHELLEGRSRALYHQAGPVPTGWTVDFTLDVVQMITPKPIGQPDPRAVPLGPQDAPAILDLVAAAKPGPFGPATTLFGGYYGIWINGTLAAMAGERFHLDGWTEISAVATSPQYRGQGLASSVIRTIASQVECRGERVFLHVVSSNPARALYEHLGFHTRTHIAVRGLTPEESELRP
jgi:ribosomal protein S18 acetylase RimI-like enzyme